MYAADDDDKNTSAEVKRVQSAATVLDQIMGHARQGDPRSLESAKCVAVVPSMIKGGFISVPATVRVGNVSYLLRRRAHPLLSAIAGGSWGLQFGGEAVDLVMLVMNDKACRICCPASSSSEPKDRLRGASWPSRRRLTPMEDACRGPDLLPRSWRIRGPRTYGAVIKQDEDDTRVLYRSSSLQGNLAGQVSPPAGTHRFVATVSKYANEVNRSRGETTPATTSTSPSTH